MEGCVIRLSIFTSQFYFILPFRFEKIKLTPKNTQPYYTFFCVITSTYICYSKF